MNCEWVKEHLHRILDGEIEASSKPKLTRHLKQCERCAGLLAQARDEERAFRSAMPGLLAPEALASRVAKELDLAKAKPGRGARRIRLWVPLSAAAAVLVAALLAHRAITKVGPAPVEWPVVATISQCEGEVLAAAPRSEDWRPVGAGSELLMGQKLSTDKDTHATIVFVNGVRMMLNGSGLARLGRTGVFLESGRAFAWVDRRDSDFAIGTRQARAVVHGTQFNVDCRTKGSTVLSVVEGVVAFQNSRGRVEVKANMRSAATTDGEPSPALYADLWDDVSWAGLDESVIDLPVDVRFRIASEAEEGAFAEQTPTFAVHLTYGDRRYADLWLRCQVTDTDGKTVAEMKERVCTRAYRYRTKKMSTPGLPPGSYRATFRIGHGRYAVSETTDFVVK